MTLNLKRAGAEVPDLPTPQYLVVNVGAAARPVAVGLAARMRRAGVGAILGNGTRALRGQMRQANALAVAYTVVIGDDEIERGEVMVRNMADSSQTTVGKPNNSWRRFPNIPAANAAAVPLVPA